MRYLWSKDEYCEEESDLEVNFFLLYKMIIFFVVDFFEDLEIVICFEGYMFRIFFVVLKDVNGRYLVENFRICLIFFMIIFKFIYDCLVDFYS